MLDPRIHAYRDDIASAELRGQVQSRNFVAGTAYQVCRGVAPIHKDADSRSSVTTQALHGEIFHVFEITNGFAWGQLQKRRLCWLCRYKRD